MKIVEIKHIEDCFDGSFIKEILFDEPVIEFIIKKIGKYGNLHYYKDFARPFYKIIFRDNFYLKGVENNLTMRVLMNNEADLELLNEILNKEEISE